MLFVSRSFRPHFRLLLGWFFLSTYVLLHTPSCTATNNFPLQGKWVAVSATSNGDPPPPGMLKRLILIFDKDKVSIMGSSMTPYTLDTNFKPAHIDILNSRRQVGIYELQGDNLRFCFGEFGDRPAEFHTEPHTDRTYILLHRGDAEQNLSCSASSLR